MRHTQTQTARQEALANQVYVKPMTNVKRQGLSFVQLIIVWGVVALLIAVVFVLGLSVGREHGFRQALDEQGQTVVRVPLKDLFSVTTQAGDVAPTGERTENTGEMAKLETQAVVEDDEKGELLPPTNARREEPTLGFMTRPAAPPETAASTATDKRAAVTAKAAPKILERDLVKPSVKEKEQPPIARVEIKDETRVSSAPLKAPTKVLSKQLKAGWYVQVTAARKQDEASDISQRLGSQGHQATVEETAVKNVPYYRVLVGPYADHAAASTALQKVRQTSGFSESPFLRQIR